MSDNQAITATTVQAIAAFQSLSLADRTELAKLLSVKRYSLNQYIISKAQRADTVYFLLSGHVRACLFTSNGKEVQFEDLNPGMMFGELAAIDGGERSSDCLAMTDVTIAAMDSTSFVNVLNTYPAVNDYVLQRLTQMVRRHLDRVYEFSAYSVKDRIRFELLRLASDGEESNSTIILDSVPTHADIASRISTHREAVTRELKRLESLEVITWRPGTYIIHNAAALTSGV